MNSLKHGLSAQTLVLRNEDPDQFDLMRRQLVEQFVPRTALEEELVEHLAAQLWRLRRAPAVETTIIEAVTSEEDTRTERFERHLAEIADRYKAALAKCGVERKPLIAKVEAKKEPKDPSLVAQKKIGLALTQSTKLLDVLARLARHEGALLNRLIKTYHLLLSLRKQHTTAHVKDPDIRYPVRRKTVAQNSVAAGAIVIAGETPSQFEDLRERLEKEHAPQTRMHLELGNYIAGLLWRLRRVPNFEVTIIEALEAKIKPTEPRSGAETEPAPQSSNRIGLALLRDGQKDDTLGKLSHLEVALTNRLTRSLQLLSLLNGAT